MIQWHLTLKVLDLSTLTVLCTSNTRLSPKSRFAPYYGREIPGWEAAGLQADKTYYGYRSAEELSKPETVESLNGHPLYSSATTLTFADAPAKETRVEPPALMQNGNALICLTL